MSAAVGAWDRSRGAGVDCSLCIYRISAGAGLDAPKEAELLAAADRFNSGSDGIAAFVRTAVGLCGRDVFVRAVDVHSTEGGENQGPAILLSIQVRGDRPRIWKWTVPAIAPPLTSLLPLNPRSQNRR